MIAIKTVVGTWQRSSNIMICCLMRQLKKLREKEVIFVISKKIINSSKQENVFISTDNRDEIQYIVNQFERKNIIFYDKTKTCSNFFSAVCSP